jgi:antitoxin HigA-1
MRERSRICLKTGPIQHSHQPEELRTIGISAAELARNLGVPTNRITQILNGQRALTGDTALRLAHFFGTTPEFWLNLQNLYEIRLAQQKSGRAIQGLPRLNSTGRAPQERFIDSVAARNRNPATDLGNAQGKIVSRGASRAR